MLFRSLTSLSLLFAPLIFSYRVSDTLVELAAFAPVQYPITTTGATIVANDEAAAMAIAKTRAASLSSEEAQSASLSEALESVATSLAMQINPNALELVVLAAAVWRRKLRVPDAPRPVNTTSADTNPSVTNSTTAEAPQNASGNIVSGGAQAAAGRDSATAGPAEWTRMAELLVASRKPTQAVLWLKRTLAFAPTHAPAVLMLAQVRK